MTRLKYLPKKAGCLTFLGCILKHRGWSLGKSGLKWVARARHGLILWESEATSLRIVFGDLPDLWNTIHIRHRAGGMRAVPEILGI